MNKFCMSIENIESPSAKVLLMYRAVSELLCEKKDVNSIKVVDITSKAGIGKGTAYEYFTSKEELIVNAMLYEYSEKFKKLSSQLNECGSFEEKIYKIFDWIKNNREYNILYSRMIRMLFGDAASCEEIKEQMPQEIFGKICAYTSNMILQLLEEGYQEGVYTETDLGKRRLAFMMMVVGYAFIAMEEQTPYFDQLDNSEITAFFYSAFIKALKNG